MKDIFKTLLDWLLGRLEPDEDYPPADFDQYEFGDRQ